MLRPTPIGIRHEVLALAHEGMRQSAIDGRMGLNRATIKRILQRHTATGTLVPGKSTGASRKITLCQDFLFRMVQPLHRGWGICMEWVLAGKPSTTGPNPVFTVPIDPQGSPWWLPYHRLCLEWAQRWHNLTMAHWQHVIFDDESRFELYPVDGRLNVCCLPGERFQQRLSGSSL